MKKLQTKQQPISSERLAVRGWPVRSPRLDWQPTTLPGTMPHNKRETSRAVLVGEAGNSLVLSRLQEWGYPTHIAMAGVAYDLIADVGGAEMIRIQVKTQSRAKKGRCTFKLQRGFYYSKSGMFPYNPEDFDVAALVCLEIGQISFFSAPVSRQSFNADPLRPPHTDSETFDLALQTLQLRRHAELISWLASMDPSFCKAHVELPPQSVESNDEVSDHFSGDVDLSALIPRKFDQTLETVAVIAGLKTQAPASDEPEAADDCCSKDNASNRPFAMRIDFGQQGQCDFRSASEACRFFKVRRGEMARQRAKTGESWETLIRQEVTKFDRNDEADAPPFFMTYPRSRVRLPH